MSPVRNWLEHSGRRLACWPGRHTLTKLLRPILQQPLRVDRISNKAGEVQCALQQQLYPPSHFALDLAMKGDKHAIYAWRTLVVLHGSTTGCVDGYLGFCNLQFTC